MSEKLDQNLNQMVEGRFYQKVARVQSALIAPKNQKDRKK